MRFYEIWSKGTRIELWAFHVQWLERLRTSKTEEEKKPLKVVMWSAGSQVKRVFQEGESDRLCLLLLS